MYQNIRRHKTSLEEETEARVQKDFSQNTYLGDAFFQFFLLDLGDQSDHFPRPLPRRSAHALDHSNRALVRVKVDDQVHLPDVQTLKRQRWW